MKRNATVVETPTPENGYFWKVAVEGRDHEFLRGTGAPAAGTEVGAKGTVEYRSGKGYGLYFWVKGCGHSGDPHAVCSDCGW